MKDPSNNQVGSTTSREWELKCGILYIYIDQPYLCYIYIYIYIHIHEWRNTSISLRCFFFDEPFSI